MVALDTVAADNAASAFELGWIGVGWFGVVQLDTESLKKDGKGWKVRRM